MLGVLTPARRRRPLVSEQYADRQIVGIDLHRRRTVIVRMTPTGEKLATVRIDNDPVVLALEIAKAGPDPEAVCCVPPEAARLVGRLEEGGGVRRGRMAVPVVERSAFAGFRFPPDVITLAVRWYLRYGLSYRDLEELLAERGIEVDHVTIYRWVQRLTPLFADAARPCRHAAGDRWFVDETYVKVTGRWRYLYRAIDQFGQVIDVMVSEQRDAGAARRFFTRALTRGPAPVEVTTDKAAAYVRGPEGIIVSLAERIG